MDRPLKKEQDFLRNKGKRILVKTFSPIDGRKKFSGTLKDFTSGVLFLEDDGNILEIQLTKIAQAKLIIEL